LGRQAVPDSRERSAPRLAATDEAELMAHVRLGDARAFERLYRSYHPRLSRFLMNLTRRPQLVEEVLNDTMLVVWRRPEGFNGASKLSTWIFAIAYRKALKALRKDDLPLEDKHPEQRASSEPGPDHRVDALQTREALLKAMHELSPAHRAVIDLTYFHDAGYREIAEIMDCPVDTVKSRMYYARRHLKRALESGPADWL
jgi:RNA polymerase sigma-70 factor (ECF subfamily)